MVYDKVRILNGILWRILFGAYKKVDKENPTLIMIVCAKLHTYLNIECNQIFIISEYFR